MGIEAKEGNSAGEAGYFAWWENIVGWNGAHPAEAKYVEFGGKNAQYNGGCGGLVVELNLCNHSGFGGQWAGWRGAVGGGHNQDEIGND